MIRIGFGGGVGFIRKYITGRTYDGSETLNIHTTMLIAIFITLMLAGFAPAGEPPVIDSAQTLRQALEGTAAPADIVAELRIVGVGYYGFDGRLHHGQIVVHRDLEDDVREIFDSIRLLRFPVESVIPIRFDLPDNRTTMDTLNNTYGFHYRAVTTSASGRISVHSYGRAIDINPFQNPAVLPDGRVIPAGSAYDTQAEGTLMAGGEVVGLFLRRGWQWGGAWSTLKDYMHFEKP